MEHLETAGNHHRGEKETRTQRESEPAVTQSMTAKQCSEKPRILLDYFFLHLWANVFSKTSRVKDFCLVALPEEGVKPWPLHNHMLAF